MRPIAIGRPRLSEPGDHHATGRNDFCNRPLRGEGFSFEVAEGDQNQAASRIFRDHRRDFVLRAEAAVIVAGVGFEAILEFAGLSGQDQVGPLE